jgi:uncharacterized repeat protein (TIGR01451 family)
VVAEADLAVSKVDTPDPVAANGDITYTVTVNNPGPLSAAAATLSDTLPAGTTFISLSAPGGWSCTTPAVGGTGLVTCSNPSFAQGSAVFTLVARVDAGVAGGTVISNTATVASTTADPNANNNSATATTTVAFSADLAISKIDTPDPVAPGANLTYTFTVTNNGPDVAQSVNFSDELPGQVTFVSIAAPAGWSCFTPAVGAGGVVQCSTASLPVGSAVVTLVVNVVPATLPGTVITNNVFASTLTNDPNPANGSSSASTTVQLASADLSVTKSDSPDPILAGNNLTYTINVANAGPSAAANVTLADTVPANTTFVSLTAPAGWSATTPAVGGTGAINVTNPSLAASANASFTLVVQVAAATANGTVISNTATVGSTTGDPTPANNSATATTTVTGLSADLSVTKTDAPDPVLAGNNLTYTITVANAGPGAAATVSLADTVPANTTFVSFTAPAGWTATTPAVGGTGAINATNPSLAASANASFTLVVQVAAATANATVISNTATVASTTSDPTPANNTATATTTVTGLAADLSVTKTDAPDPVIVGSDITYTITANNAGPNAATSVTLTDAVPANTTFVSLAAPAGWTATAPAVGATGTISATRPSLASGTPQAFTLVVRVNAGVAAGTVISNTASIASTTADPTPANNSATTTTTTSALPVPNVTGTKAVSGTYTPGSNVTYTIVLTNSGTGAQGDNLGNEFIDVLPAALQLVSATASSGTAVATVGTNTVTWNGALAAGASATITITAAIPAAAVVGSTVMNQGTLNTDLDANGTNETARTTDNPATAGADATGFVVAGVAIPFAAPITIPAFGDMGRALLALLLGLFAMTALGRGALRR